MIDKNRRIQYYKEIFRTNQEYFAAEKRMYRTEEIYSQSDELYIYAMIPVLLEYVKWVLKDAIASGKRRLYFLARDGYQMYIVAKALTEEMNLDIECRYLSVSRFSMRVPEYHLIKEECLNRIFVRGIDVTFEKICKRAALSEKQIDEIAEECGFEGQLKRVLTYQEILQVKDEFKTRSNILEMIYQHSRDAYPNAMGYLEQEGMFDDIPFALVDSGWIGTLQQTIQNLLRSKKEGAAVEGYYFGMYEYPKDSNRNQYHPFYFSPTKGLKRKVYFSNCLFEAVFSAPEGMTLNYQNHNYKYEPMFDLHENPNADQLKRNIHLLEEFLKQYRENIIFLDEDERSGLFKVERILEKFMGYPSSTEIDAYGNVLFSDDVLEGQLQKVSAELSQQEIKKQRFLSKVLIMSGLKNETIHESAWIEGSIVRNGTRIEENLKHAHLYKYFVYIRKALQQGERH